jgi:hypothetical protein
MTATLTYRWQRREASFFLIGMLLVPVFWVWWTLQSRFKPWQRVLALAWTALWIALLVVWRRELPDAFEAVAIGLPYWCLLVSVVLWFWLLFRVGIIHTLVEILLILFVFSPALSSTLMIRISRGDVIPFEPLAWVAVPLVIHLGVNCLRGGKRRSGA